MLDMKKAIFDINPENEVSIDFIQNGQYKTIKIRSF